VTAVINPRENDVVADIRERTAGLGVDVAIECAGNEAALRSCLGAVRTNGTVAQVGLHVKDAAIDMMEVAERELTIKGTWCYSVHEWPRIMGMIASGMLPVERTVSAWIELDRSVDEGFERLIDPAGDQTKVLVQTS
jgi:(R,R)-butanediol dehydrogenase/meso-butanediol dehydrogenase/diacetyl reductase